MLSSSTVESLEDKDTRIAVKTALATLWASGVFMAESAIESQKLLSGPADQPITGLAVDIQEYRRRVQQLQTIHELGQQYNKEINS